jgi:hypothetical protein
MVRSSVCLALFAVLAFLSTVQAQSTNRAPAEIDRATATHARTVEAEFTSSGRLQLVLLFDRLEIESPYGQLSIPVEEIRTIEFATRHSAELKKKIDDHIFKLGSVNFTERDNSEKELLALAEKAYPALLMATKHADLEVARRAQELVVRIGAAVPAEQLAVREQDIVETTHSKIAGKIAAETISVETGPFGKQSLRLSDVRSMRSLKVDPPQVDIANVEPDPGSLTAYHASIGKTFAFKVTGRAEGFIWGTGVYTTDSSLATAAVHAGALKPGETGVVRVTIMASPPAFTGSTQNGVTSNPYGMYAAAYEILVPRRR